MKRPIIGITSYLVSPHEMGNARPRGLPDQEMQMTTMDYARAVTRAGGLPWLIPVIQDQEMIEGIVGRIDGLILSGGPDLCPSTYHQEAKVHLGKINPRRDAFEMAICASAMAASIPIMGICRGFQLLNVFFGGSLVQHHTSEIEHTAICGPKDYPAHRITLTEPSILSACFGAQTIWVNSFHHQVVDRLGEKLKVTAKASDGVIEGFVHQERPDVFGVQWHPEMMEESHPIQRKLFRYLINATEK